MAMKKEKRLPPPYTEETKDTRFAGTFEVLVPVPERVKPYRVPQQFPTQQAAEAWLHSEEGREAVRDALADAAKPKKS
jgi:hypothetical protein